MSQRLPVLAALLVAPSLALAQSFTVTESNDQDGVVNIAECQNAGTDGLTFSFSAPVTITLPASPTFTLVASDKVNCPTDSTSAAHNYTISATVPATNATTSATGSFPATGTVAVNTILQNVQVNCEGAATAVYFCATLNGVTGATTTGSITLDLQRPPAPNIESVTPGDGALNVTWTAGSGGADGGTGTATSYRIEATDPGTGNTAKKTVTGPNGGRIDGLANGTTYDVVVIALSSGGNESTPSTALQGTPVLVLDFWRNYKQDSGREQGGCASGAAGLVALLALAPLALRARRRRS